MRVSVQMLIGGLLVGTGLVLGACNLIFGVNELTYDSNIFGTGGSGGATGSDCQTVFDCPTPEDECVDRVCDFGNCVAVSRAAGTPCPGGVCDGAGSCDTPLGDPCSDPASCPSGFCVDGVCCDEACSGDCVACDRSGEEGACGPVLGMAEECPVGGCDGAGSCFQCGVASTEPSPPPCPAVCSSCDGGTCTIDCSLDSCAGQSIACPAGYDCQVDCISASGCAGTNVVCPDDNRACHLTCTAIDACVEATLDCGVGPCSLLCGVQNGACDAVVMTCGVQSCTATCQGNTAPALHGCLSSCNCEIC